MIKSYSQRLTPPYSGQVQIAESDRARAVSMDGENWEIHFLYAISKEQSGMQKPRLSFRRVAFIKYSQLDEILEDSSKNNKIDERIFELSNFLKTASLPFPAIDNYEFWLLDKKDESPLALIFSCNDAEQMATFPFRPEWTALSAAALPIEATTAEKERSEPPVNYRLENLVAERAGQKPNARWFHRRENVPDEFPSLLIREDWEDRNEHELCQRYIQRQSSRLLMLHGLSNDDRYRLEVAARDHVFEVNRFFPLYPDIADEDLMNAIRVQARLSNANQEESQVMERRDGILYI